MAKVITSAGLQDFIETGKTETMKPVEVPKEAPKEEPKAEVKPEEKPKDQLRADPVTKAEAAELAKEADGDLMPEETLEQARAKINKKHRALKAEEALRQKYQQEAEEAERLAESQYNERRLVEAERDRLRQELEQARSRLQPAEAKPEIKAPSKDDPEFRNEKGEFDIDKYVDAKTAYQFKVREAEAEAKTRLAEQTRIDSEFRQQIDKARQAHPDFQEVIDSYQTQDIPLYLLEAIKARPLGAEIAYHFGKNQDDIRRISRLPPIAALAEIGKVEARLEKVPEKVEEKVPEAPVRTSTAPPPITPISSQGAGTVTTDPAKMSFKELRAFEREKNKRKG